MGIWRDYSNVVTTPLAQPFCMRHEKLTQKTVFRILNNKYRRVNVYIMRIFIWLGFTFSAMNSQWRAKDQCQCCKYAFEN